VRQPCGYCGGDYDACVAGRRCCGRCHSYGMRPHQSGAVSDSGVALAVLADGLAVLTVLCWLRVVAAILF